MSSVTENTGAPKKHRQRGKNRRIGFTQEVITKNVAKTLLSQENSMFITESHPKKYKEVDYQFEQPTVKIKKKIKSDQISNVEKSERCSSTNNKKNKRKEIDGDLSQSKVDNEEKNSDKSTTKFKKQKVSKGSDNITSNTDAKDTAEIEKNNTSEENSEKTSSKRALKKMKHQKLLEKKKNKLDAVLKQKALNYLSDWKHDNINWKFQKLKQIWLLQNLYDATKIEDTLWDTVVEYFSNSKGKVHKTILDEAIKIIENEVNSIGDNGKIKLNRARDIIQNLQE